jgi:hypothetical protein
MNFKVLNENSEDLNLSAGDLFDVLSSKINIQDPRKEFELLNEELYKSLEKANVVTPIFNKNLMMNVFYICFSIGYYYRLFLEKNEVELKGIEQNDQEST